MKKFTGITQDGTAYVSGKKDLERCGKLLQRSA